MQRSLVFVALDALRKLTAGAISNILYKQVLGNVESVGTSEGHAEVWWSGEALLLQAIAESENPGLPPA